MKSAINLALLFTLLLLLAAPLTLSAALIDLNDFVADPQGVTVSTDGTSAELAEVLGIGVVFLANDPGLGDPVLLSDGPGAWLSFDYDFTLGAGEADEFIVTLFDSEVEDGPIDGILDSLLVTSTMVGTATFDLSAYADTVLGLEFQLNSLNDDPDATGSRVTISNLAQTVPAEPVAVPAVPALGNLLAALMVTAVTGRARHRGQAAPAPG